MCIFVSQHKLFLKHLFFSGTYFILYDFIDYFEKDGPSFLQRDKYHDIVNTIFKNMSRLEKDAIVFQVSFVFSSFFLLYFMAYWDCRNFILFA